VPGSQVIQTASANSATRFHFLLARRCYGDDSNAKDAIRRILARLEMKERLLQSLDWSQAEELIGPGPAYGDSRRSMLAPAYNGGSRRSMLSPAYGDSRRSMLAAVYGDSRRLMLSPSYGGSRYEDTPVPPAYGLSHSPSYPPSYGSLHPPPYGSSHTPAYPIYGHSETLSRRSMEAQGDFLSREALHEALAFVLDKQKKVSGSDSTVAGVSITGPKSCPQGFRRSLKRALPNAANPTYECIPLTTSSSTSSPLLDLIKQPGKGVLPEGKCYCKFDHDWDEWSLSEPSCRNALYERSSDLRSGLPSSWLDAFYNYRPKLGSIISPPHVDQISAFLYSDCLPAPPCSCNNLTLESTMSPKALSCYSEVQIQAADPYRLVPAQVLQLAVTQGHSDVGAEGVERWMDATFPAPACKAYQGQPYTYQALPSTQVTSSTSASVFESIVDGIGGWRVVIGIIVGISVGFNIAAIAMFVAWPSRREERALREKLIGGGLVYN
jgi:hypothetical protein